MRRTDWLQRQQRQQGQTATTNSKNAKKECYANAGESKQATAEGKVHYRQFVTGCENLARCVVLHYRHRIDVEEAIAMIMLGHRNDDGKPQDQN